MPNIRGRVFVLARRRMRNPGSWGGGGRWRGWLAKNELTEETIMQGQYHAVVRQSGNWWIGWVEEIPGVNSQGTTREELLGNLRDALEEALEMNRQEARQAAGGN